MGTEGTRERLLLAVALALALATGCTTTVIDLAARDASVDVTNVPTQDGADAEAAPLDLAPSQDGADVEAAPLDLAPSPDAADAEAAPLDLASEADATATDLASPGSFEEAYDAGMVPIPGAALYVKFTCCDPVQTTKCVDEPPLGGPDACGEYKAVVKRADDFCVAAKLALGDYALYGACTP
ncbi:MAG TPA: hypothetical protein VIU64_12855 [Polyangia bacterium]